MKEIIGVEGKVCYRCEQCGFIYPNMETAERCEAWCSEHRSCNLDITKYAMSADLEKPNKPSAGSEP
jgi:hypothetical protein